MTILYNISNFYISFFPLWILIIIKNTMQFFSTKRKIVEYEMGKFKPTYIEIIVNVVIVFLFILFLIYLLKELSKKQARTDGTNYKIEKINELKALSSEFIISYVMSLYVFDFTIVEDIILFCVFYFILLFVCLRHNYMYTNVFLELLNYKYYDCELIRDGTCITKIILSNKNLHNYLYENINITSLSNECYVSTDNVMVNDK